MRPLAIVLTLLIFSAGLKAQEYQRPVSWKELPTNILDDQKHIWLFPSRLERKRVWIPTAIILGATAGLIALDAHDAPYFRRTSTFNGFNNVFTGNATAIGTVIAPVSLYAGGLLRRDSKMQQTALLAGEAVVDTEILATVLKDATKRVRPAAFGANQNFADRDRRAATAWPTSTAAPGRKTCGPSRRRYAPRNLRSRSVSSRPGCSPPCAWAARAALSCWSTSSAMACTCRGLAPEQRTK